MKYISLIILCSLICLKGVSQNYDYEDNLINCLYGASESAGFNLKLEFSKFENYLIQQKILSDRTGQSYYDIYSSIKDTDDVNFEIDYSLPDSVGKNFDSNLFQQIFQACSKVDNETLENELYLNSRLFELNKAIENSRLESISPGSVAGVIIDVLTPSDFEHDYYKFTTILTIITLNSLETGLERQLPTLEEVENTERILERNNLKIHVSTNKDSIYVDSVLTSIDELPLIIEKKLLSDNTVSSNPEKKIVEIELIGECYQTQLVISLTNDSKALYSTYILTQNMIIKAYNKVRNLMSLQYFEADWNNLDENQKKAIRKLIPKRVVEAEPTN